MPSPPHLPDLLDQSGLTFGDHLLDLAEAVGVAELVDDSGNAIAPRIPTDAARLDMLKRAWNRGYEAFVAGVDPMVRPRRPYTGWNFLDRMVEIELNPDGTGPHNIDGDETRYRLPAGVCSRPKHAWVLTIDGRSTWRTIEDTTSHRVQAFLASSAASGSAGYPFMAACRPIEAPEGNAEGAAWEVIVAPKPTAVAWIRAQFRLVQRPLVQTDERHICGAQHDSTLRAFALAEWARRDASQADQFGRYAQDAASKLDASIAMDKDLSPRVVGPVHDPGVSALPVYRPQGRRASGVVVNYVTS